MRLFLDLSDPASRQAWLAYGAAAKAVDPRLGRTPRLVVHPLPLARNPRARAVAAAVISARILAREQAFCAALLAHSSLSDAAITKAAAEAKLPKEAFARLWASASVAGQVERERRAAIRFGVRATPSALLVGEGVGGVPATGRARPIVAAALRRWRACRAVGVADCEGGVVALGGVAAEAAFTALRRLAARTSIARKSAVGSSAADASTRGSTRDSAGAPLGARWRVTLPKSPLQLPGSPNAVAVWFVDLSDPHFTRGASALLAASQAEQLRLVLMPVAAQEAGMTAALAVHGWSASNSGDGRDAALRGLLRRGGGALASLAAGLGSTKSALARVARSGEAIARLQEALALAQGVDARPGTLFLNGRRWRGPLTAARLQGALTKAKAEAAALRGLLGRERYGRLIGPGRWRSPAEADLAPPRGLAARAQFADLGSGPAQGRAVHAWLWLDLRQMASRAMFYSLKFLRDDPQTPVHLHVAVLGPSAAPPRRARGGRRRAKTSGAITANTALWVASAHGKGLACVEGLLRQRRPHQPKHLRRLFKRLGLKPSLLDARALSASTRRATAVLRRAERDPTLGRPPVLVIGERRYIGPIDENSIRRAVRWVATHAAARQPQATPRQGRPSAKTRPVPQQPRSSP